MWFQMKSAGTYILHNLIIVLLAINIVAALQNSLGPEGKPKHEDSKKNISENVNTKELNVIKLKSKLNPQGANQNEQVIILGKNSASTKSDVNPMNVTNQTVPVNDHNNSFKNMLQPNVDNDLIGSGALLRGFYVFLGLSTICLMYFAFKSYRLRKGGQPPQHVRKYGVRARRGDVEMLPLPLDEDEDDDTVFDVGNHSNR